MHGMLKQQVYAVFLALHRKSTVLVRCTSQDSLLFVRKQTFGPFSKLIQSYCLRRTNMNGVPLIGSAPAVPVLPAGGYSGTQYADKVAVSSSPAVTKPFSECAPEIQELATTMLGIYTARGHEELTKVYDRFKHNCIFDLPFFFVHGADRMRVLSNLLAIQFDKVVAEPKLLSVQMLNNKLGRIDVDGTLHLYPRLRFLPFASLILPDSIPLHATWTIVATGDDDKIISVTETIHNVVSVPRLLRSIWTTVLTTAGLAVSSW